MAVPPPLQSVPSPYLQPIYAAKACALSDIPSAGREKYDPTEVGRVLCFDFSTEDCDLMSSMRLTLRRAAHVAIAGSAN